MFVALGIQHVMCTVHTVICDLSGYTIFFHIIINGTIFENKDTENKMCILIFFTTFVWNISNSRKNRARCDKKVYIGAHVKYTLSLSDFNECWIFSPEFRKYFMKRGQVGAESFLADMMQVTVAFHNCMNAPNYWMNFDEIC